MALNKVLLIGNVGKEPEVRSTAGGNSVATFTLATTERFKDRNGESHENTEWHTIVCWAGLATLAENYIHKGSQVYVEGKIASRSWDDKDGEKHFVTEIKAEAIQLLDRKKREDEPRTEQPRRSVLDAAAAAQKQSNAPSRLFSETDDLPFD